MTIAQNFGDAIRGIWSDKETFVVQGGLAIKLRANWSDTETFIGQLTEELGNPIRIEWEAPETFTGAIAQAETIQIDWTDRDTVSLVPIEREKYEMLRILPLGDNLTSGQGNISYRSQLWNNFKTTKRIDFVGSKKHGIQTMDRDHAGHDSFTSVQLDGITQNELVAHDPDMVLLLIGTNDSNNSANNSLAYRDNLQAIINRIKSYDNQIIIVLMTLIPVKNNTTRNNRINSYNTEIRNIVSLDSSLVLADINPLMDLNQYVDDVHPTTVGYSTIANELFRIIGLIPGERYNRVRKKNNDIPLNTIWNDSESFVANIAQPLNATWHDIESFNISGIEDNPTSPLEGGLWNDSESFVANITQALTATWDDIESFELAIELNTGVDSVVADWMNNVTANEGTYTSSEIAALNTLILAWKNNGTWDKILCFNPCFGQNWKAAQVKVKAPVSISILDTLRNHTSGTYSIVDGWIGSQSNTAGSLREIRTDFAPGIQGCVASDFGMWFDTPSFKGSGAFSIWIMGMTENAPTTGFTNTTIYENNGQLRGSIHQVSTEQPARIDTNVKGLLGIQSEDNQQSVFYVNKTPNAISPENPGVDLPFRNGEIYVQNRWLGDGSNQRSTGRRCRGYMITKRITDMDAFYDPWLTFKQTIGRG
ncbi:MAG: hypothetical protein HC878_00190 [Leptolyngbyaceae cyanobacterium SL_5_14]|nr:hypothetical protein [Leptolyngbyaceae cyanobacterium SL_5_14]